MDSYRLHASQAHGGSVNTLNTPKVQYSYASGSTNSIRMTGMTYPNGRTVVNDYGTADLIDDACSRIQSMKDSGAAFNLADYQYLGLSGFVNAASAHRFCPLSPVPGGEGQGAGEIARRHGRATASGLPIRDRSAAVVGPLIRPAATFSPGVPGEKGLSFSNGPNEITVINNTTGAAWGTPTYDRAGNMIGMPNPGTTVTGSTPAWVPLTETQWQTLTEADGG